MVLIPPRRLGTFLLPQGHQDIQRSISLILNVPKVIANPQFLSVEALDYIAATVIIVRIARAYQAHVKRYQARLPEVPINHFPEYHMCLCQQTAQAIGRRTKHLSRRQVRLTARA